MKTHRTWTSLVWMAALLVLAVAPAVADAVPPGDDVWKTSTKGFTYSSFSDDPVPADFFCLGSKPFTGRLNLRGERLAAEPAANLGDFDTVVRRLDDARFDEAGKAKTRIQLLALNLVSAEPIETACGRYDVAVRLDGAQPTTEMTIVRTTAGGGYYVAPLALNIKIAFTPVAGNKNPRRELSRQIKLGSADVAVWSSTAPAFHKGPVRIDTNGDGEPDTLVPAASKGFVAGVAPMAQSDTVDGGGGGGDVLCPYESCHCTEGSMNPFEPNYGCEHLHCTTVYLTAADCTQLPTPPDPG
jgi:hypothetical protein